MRRVPPNHPLSSYVARSVKQREPSYLTINPPKIQHILASACCSLMLSIHDNGVGLCLAARPCWWTLLATKSSSTTHVCFLKEGNSAIQHTRIA